MMSNESDPIVGGGDTPFIRFSAVKEDVSLWLGMLAMFAWIDLILCFEGALRDAVAEGGGLIHDPVFLSTTFCATALFFVLPRVFRKDGHRLMERGGVVAIFSTAGALCSGLAVMLTSVAASVPVAVSVLLGCAVGACIVVLTLLWGRCLAALDIRRALVVVSIAACLQWLPLVILEFLPVVVRALIVAVLPALSGFIVHRRQSEEPRKDSRKPALVRSDLLTLRRMAAMTLLFSATIQFLLAYFIKMLSAPLAENVFAVVFAILMALTAAIMAGALVIMRRERNYRLEFYYRMTFMLCVCGAGAFMLVSQTSLVAYLSIYAGYSLIMPTMWMIALGFAFMTRMGIDEVLAPITAMQYLGFALGFLTVNLLAASSMAGEGTTLAPYVCVVAILVFSTAYLWVFPERELLNLSPVMFGLGSANIEERCGLIAERYGLTQREGELLVLFACGRNSGYIEDAFVISKNTVASHRKSIYRKLGVHTQQELLTMIAGEFTGDKV